MYTPLIDAVEQAYQEAARAFESLERGNFRVLVPHAGVGRLCWELVLRGFSVEGCEASLTSILASNYFLNHASASEPDLVYPFAHEHRNVRSGAEQTRGVAVPDVSASATPIESEFGMRTGDFLAFISTMSSAGMRGHVLRVQFGRKHRRGHTPHFPRPAPRRCVGFSRTCALRA